MARPRRAEPAAATLALLLATAACAGPAGVLPVAAPRCAASRPCRPPCSSGWRGGGVEPVSRPEWEAFAAATVTPRFPEGFTVLEGRGQWRNPATGMVAREDTVVLLVVAPHGPETLRRLDEVAAGWRRRFLQQSVGIVTAPVCAAF